MFHWTNFNKSIEMNYLKKVLWVVCDCHNRGAGFIGSTLAKRLSEQKKELKVIDIVPPSGFYYAVGFLFTKWFCQQARTHMQRINKMRGLLVL